MNRDSIWWRLTPLAAWLTAVSLFGLVAWRATAWKPPLEAILPLGVGLLLPNLYLTSFSLWHWKFRYRGSHPVAWAVAFPLFWSYVPALFYFDRHVNRDRKGKRPYSDLGTVPPLDLPGRYNTIRSVAFVLGGALLGWAALSSIILAFGHWAILGVFDEALDHNVGKVLTAGEVNALHIAGRVNRVLVVNLCVTAMAGTLGGVLLSLSHSIRWRLKEQDERKTSNDTPDGIRRPAEGLPKSLR